MNSTARALDAMATVFMHKFTSLCEVFNIQNTMTHFVRREVVMEYKMAMDGDYSNVKNIKKAQAYSLP